MIFHSHTDQKGPPLRQSILKRKDEPNTFFSCLLALPHSVTEVIFPLLGLPIVLLL